MPSRQPLSLELLRRGDEAAMAAAIARMMPAIRRGAAFCAGPGMEFEDAVQEGIIGLFRAIQTYDPGRGASFETCHPEVCGGRVGRSCHPWRNGKQEAHPGGL